MKNLLASSFTFLFLLVLGNCISQNYGMVIYNLSYQNIPENMKALEHKLPTEKILRFNGDSVSVSNGSAFYAQFNEVWNLSAETGFLSVSFPNQGFLIEKNETDWVEKKETSKIVTTYKKTGQTKNICGLTCSLYQIQYAGYSDVYDVWLADGFSGSYNFEVFGLPAMPMEITIPQSNGSNFVYKAISYNNDMPGSGYFMAPIDFQKVTMEEFTKILINLDQQ